MGDLHSNVSSTITAGSGIELTFTAGADSGDYLDITIATTGGAGAPGNVDYLVGTADATLTNEIVVGTSPGGELGGTWGTPTVDTTHSGSSHAGVVSTHEAAGDPHTGYRLESADHTHATTGLQAGQLDHGTALTGLSDDDHPQYALDTDLTTHAGAADPHTGYRLESADHTHATTGLQAGQLDHGTALTGLTDDDHTQYRLESVDHTHQSTGAEAGKLDHGLALNGLTDNDHTQYILHSIADAQGDLLVASAADTFARLAKGSAGTFVQAGASTLAFADVFIPVTFAFDGTLTTTTGAFRWYNDSGRALTVSAVRASVGTAPTGASIIVDVNEGGTTMYTTQGNRPTIAISGNTTDATLPDDTSLADNGYLTVDIDQIGSTVAGANLTVTIWLKG